MIEPREREGERIGRRLRVLVIDDDEKARDTVSRLAMRQGTVLLAAATGLQGVATAQSERPDVILLDMMMPGVGGHEVLARLHADEKTARIPVIVVTSRFINDDERREILSRASAVIFKHELSRDAVTSAIDSALRRP